ncbi:membrane-spanning 4-domains subfamily A member 3-like [Monodelphis domestica]|uniref:Membrane-spanning 4-domains subfamily A member 3-like n=1 Tax=Monodelphis domestica TaxID=13616 RepID=K7E0X3_MONDO|nr:membrane-spanning 4-domains subfamily A member 3-like [Monodelphis domestica]
MAQQIGESPQCVATSINNTHIMQLGKGVAARSSYNPLDESMKVLMGKQKVFGALQILNGALILAIGIFLGSLQYVSQFPRNVFFMIFYTGYPVWGAASFIISGSLSIVAEEKPTKNLVQSSFGMNIASATISLVGIIFLLINFVLINWEVRSCPPESPNVCTLTSSVSIGLLSLMMILTVLELCFTLSLTILGCKINCCESNEETLYPPDSSMVIDMAPTEQHSEGLEASIPEHNTEILSK